MSRQRRQAFQFGDQLVPAGRTAIGRLPVPPLVTGAQTSLPVRVTHGAEEGPTVWISAAIHGDEIGGVEIIRRVAPRLDPRRIHGTILTIPIVNQHGFMTGDRYLPDRRDLNRSFPGSRTGSLAAQIAHSFMTEIVQRCDIGIDLHTGSDHRTNLPQIRADLYDADTRAVARAFGAPIVLHSKLRDGSLRTAATDAGVTVLLYEGGEAWRFDEDAIRVGVAGTLRALSHVGVIETDEAPPPVPPIESYNSAWIRGRRSGIAVTAVSLGDEVVRGQVVATIHDSLGTRLSRATAPWDGIVIGLTQHPLVHQGDALIHLAHRQEESKTIKA